MRTRTQRIFLLTATALLAACGKGGAPQQQQMPPPEVGVQVAKAQVVPITRDLVGRVSATRTADVRARVPGVLQKRVYTEGANVKEGELLFKIDPAPLQAALNVESANLAAAEATYTNNQKKAQRARAIADKGLMSTTDYDNALADERTAAAAMKQAQARVDTAKINLGYANVTAPIAGRASQQKVTEGALVGQGEATLLTTVEQIDPVYVNFSQAVGELDLLKRGVASGLVELDAPGKAKIELLRPDGSPYGINGTLDFSDAAVDAATGAVNLRGIAANPEHTLLPGMFVNVRVTVGALKHAWLVPQAAVQRDAKGAYVYVLGGDGKIAQKYIDTYTTQGADWIVYAGVADGDQIVTSGVMKVRPGAPAKVAAPQPQGAQQQAGPQGAQAPALQKKDETKKDEAKKP